MAFWEFSHLKKCLNYQVQDSCIFFRCLRFLVKQCTIVREIPQNYHIYICLQWSIPTKMVVINPNKNGKTNIFFTKMVDHPSLLLFPKNRGLAAADVACQAFRRNFTAESSEGREGVWVVSIYTSPPKNLDDWLKKQVLYVYTYTLQGTNISPQNGILKMIFLFPRRDMLISWRVYIIYIYVYIYIYILYMYIWNINLYCC